MDWKKKPNTTSLVISMLLGIYFIYKGVLFFGAGLIIGLFVAICGIILVGYSGWNMFFNKKQENDE